MSAHAALVIGSGIAGLSCALKLAAAGHRTLVITKKRRVDSSTNYAQGGIACVTSGSDDTALHVQDTLEAGAGLCNQEAVRTILTEGPARVAELAEMGVAFSQLEDGRPSLGKEGGHSKRRILHAKDATGAAIESALVAACEAHPNIETREHVYAVNLIKHKEENGGSIRGVYAYNSISGQVESLAAPVVVLASGGAGHAYLYTTNPSIATGDGIAMAHRAGAVVKDMEFVQFHPTALYTLGGKERFLISEAVRGEGAVLRNLAGKAFMENYHPRGSLAPRDVVARAIDTEMKRAGTAHVWLDCTEIPTGVFATRFPNILAACTRLGLQPSAAPIPVVPAAHYLCGGVATNLHAATNIPGLYAIGEVACTGLHGANRLASNSLLEAVVMAHRCAHSAHAYLSALNKTAASVATDPIQPWEDGNVSTPSERVVLLHNKEELKRTLWDYVGIVRSPKRLARAQRRITLLTEEIESYYWNFKLEPELIELRNMLAVAQLMVSAAQARTGSVGLHYITED